MQVSQSLNWSSTTKCSPTSCKTGAHLQLTARCLMRYQQTLSCALLAMPILWMLSFQSSSPGTRISIMFTSAVSCTSRPKAVLQYLATLPKLRRLTPTTWCHFSKPGASNFHGRKPNGFHGDFAFALCRWHNPRNSILCFTTHSLNVNIALSFFV